MLYATNDGQKDIVCSQILHLLLIKITNVNYVFGYIIGVGQ